MSSLGISKQFCSLFCDVVEEPTDIMLVSSLESSSDIIKGKLSEECVSANTKQ